MSTTRKSRKTPVLPEKCPICGKPFKNDGTKSKGIGNRCSHIQALGGIQALNARKITAAAVPAGYVKLAALGKLCEKKGVPVNRLVNAIGRDRMSEGPVHPICTPVYVANVRYVDGWLATPEGLKALMSGNYGKAPNREPEKVEEPAKE